MYSDEGWWPKGHHPRRFRPYSLHRPLARQALPQKEHRALRIREGGPRAEPGDFLLGFDDLAAGFLDLLQFGFDVRDLDIGLDNRALRDLLHLVDPSANPAVRRGEKSVILPGVLKLPAEDLAVEVLRPAQVARGDLHVDEAMHRHSLLNGVIVLGQATSSLPPRSFPGDAAGGLSLSSQILARDEDLQRRQGRSAGRRT